jgi:hypothetical protein
MKHLTLLLLILAAVGTVVVSGVYACCGRGGARFALDEETEVSSPMSESVPETENITFE